MKKTDKRGPAPDAPRQRISGLSETMLRINASLDVATVLREVVDSARALIGACYGAITTVDENGRPQDFITSGVSEEEEQRLANWLPDGPTLFEHFRDLDPPLRVDNLPAYVRALVRIQPSENTGHGPVPRRRGDESEQETGSSHDCGMIDDFRLAGVEQMPSDGSPPLQRVVARSWRRG